MEKLVIKLVQVLVLTASVLAEYALEGEFPFAASFDLEGDHQCSGVILNEKWIVTTDTCADYRRENVVVVVGTNNYEEPNQTLPIDKVIYYQKRDSEEERAFYDFSIALVKLKKPIEFNNKTQAIEISDEYPDSCEDLEAIGWYTFTDDKKLHVVYGKLTGLDYCEMPEDLDNTFCIKDAYKGRNARQYVFDGIGGAVLGNNRTLLGLVYITPQQQIYKLVGAAISTTYYKDWIQDTINNN